MFYGTLNRLTDPKQDEASILLKFLQLQLVPTLLVVAVEYATCGVESPFGGPGKWRPGSQNTQLSFILMCQSTLKGLSAEGH